MDVEKFVTAWYKEHDQAIVGPVFNMVRAALRQDRARCIDCIEAMRNCFCTKSVDVVIDRIRQGGE